MKKIAEEPDLLTRRKFFTSLACLAITASVPLPIGIDREGVKKVVVMQREVMWVGVMHSGIVNKNMKQLVKVTDDLPL